jgi:DNA-binding transcriptional MerR regulator
MSEKNTDKVIETLDQYVDGENVYYTSGEVAGMVGLTRDMVRYYTNEFSEFINPEKTNGGHLRYHAEDIELLRLILSLLKKHTPSEIKIILSDKDVKMVYSNVGDEQQGLLKLLLENNKYLASQIAEDLDKRILESQSFLLEQKQEKLDLHDELIAEMNDIKKENQELKNILLNVLEKMDDKPKRKGFLGLFKS